MSSLSPRRIVVIGAGAAGAMAAVFAASSGAETLLLERTQSGGKKILISGGGRCNILPARFDAAAGDSARFVTDSSPHALRKILRSWSLQDQISFFENEVGVRLVEEQVSGKLFPVSNRARDVRDGLLDLVSRRGARLVSYVKVTNIQPCHDRWRVEGEGVDAIEADAVILATGGLSIPETGSSGSGLRFAQTLGHTMHPTYPALVPVLAPPSPFTALSGVSLTATVTAASERETATATGGFLFTHRGYSGPAVLDVSHVLVRARMANLPARLTAQWSNLTVPAWNTALEAVGRRTVIGAVRQELPARLADTLIACAAVDPNRTLAQLRRDERARILDALVRCELPWTGDEGYRKAEITGGGVSLADVDTRTLESRHHPGLFFCGEILDAFGPIGGYNFLWAWVTGRAAGLGAARKLMERNND